MKKNARSGNLHRQTSQTFKRVLTSDYTHQKSTHQKSKMPGDEDVTTVYGSIKVRQQLDCYSNLYKPSQMNYPRRRLRLDSNSSRHSLATPNQPNDSPSEASQRSWENRRMKQDAKQQIRKMRIAKQKMIRAN